MPFILYQVYFNYLMNVKNDNANQNHWELTLLKERPEGFKYSNKENRGKEVEPCKGENFRAQGQDQGT